MDVEEEEEVEGMAVEEKEGQGGRKRSGLVIV